MAEALLAISSALRERWWKRKFTINGKTLTAEEAFGVNGMLVVFMPKATAKCREDETCHIEVGYVRNMQALSEIAPALKGYPEDINSLKTFYSAISQVVEAVEPKIERLFIKLEKVYPLDALYHELSELCNQGEKAIEIGSTESADALVDKLVEAEANDEAADLLVTAGTIWSELGDVGNDRPGEILSKLLSVAQYGSGFEFANSLLGAQYELERTEENLKETKGEFHEVTLAARVRLAYLHYHADRLQEAVECFETVIGKAARHYGRDHELTAKYFEELESFRKHCRDIGKFPTVRICSEDGFKNRSEQESEENNKKRLVNLKGLTQNKNLPYIHQRALEEIRHIGAEHPNFSEVTELVLDTLHGQMLACSAAQLPPMLLVGPPGIGKTRYISRIAKALHLPFSNIQLAGVGDAFPITGLSRYWSTAAEGSLTRIFIDSKVANPIFLLDEIDKVGRLEKCDPLSAILLLLEEGTTRAFKDQFIDIPMDISHASFLASANDIGGLPAPLLSRFQIIHIKPLDLESRRTMIRSTYQELLAEEGLSVLLGHLLPDATVEELANYQTLGGRELKRELKMAIHRACREFEMGQPMRLVPLQTWHLKLAKDAAKKRSTLSFGVSAGVCQCWRVLERLDRVRSAINIG